VTIMAEMRSPFQDSSGDLFAQAGKEEEIARLEDALNAIDAKRGLRVCARRIFEAKGIAYALGVVQAWSRGDLGEPVMPPSLKALTRPPMGYLRQRIGPDEHRPPSKAEADRAMRELLDSPHSDEDVELPYWFD